MFFKIKERTKIFSPKILSYFLLFLSSIFSFHLLSDSFKYNSYNNHGVVGLINTPSARFYDESVYGVTFYDGTPPQKITLTSNPFDWLEASFFYVNIQGMPYPNFTYQDYKDKGFNIKFRIKEEGKYPALAVGINDIAGTGYFGSEYIVATYGINQLDFNFGFGWGALNGSKDSIKNPFGYISNNFKERPSGFEGQGGQFQPSRYFSGKYASPFYGISYALNNKMLLKIEKDTTLINGKINYQLPKSDYSFGLDYMINNNFSIGVSHERGNYVALKITYKNNPTESLKRYKYKKASISEKDSKYKKLIKNLEENGIGVNKISETSKSLGLEITQFIHSDIDLVEDIISQASFDAGINKNIKKDFKIANLTAVSEIDKSFLDNAVEIYERDRTKSFNSSTTIKFRPFIASREEFFKGALMLENDSEFIINDGLFLNTNLKYSLLDNFNDFRFKPVDVYPAQVRSDVKEYLRNINNGILIGRAQLDYHLSPKKNNHLMFTGGILEDMFSGYGFEYLYFKQDSNYALGFEAFKVYKRDYKWEFGLTDYENQTGSVNLYYRNYGYLPFDLKLSYGKYLAGDIGTTFEISRSFRNGTQFGVFASFTDVTSEQYGEGSFDKGIFFNIPIYGNFISYTWRPLTKDPGAKLNRRHTLHDLLVKFKPIN